MLQSLKQKTLVGKLWAIIVLAVAAIFIGVVFGPGIAKMIAGPTHFTPLDDHDVLSLQGQYLEADIDTLIDYYAETVRSESGKRDEVSAREYIMPINTPDATVYIGVEVPKPKISDAEAVVGQLNASGGRRRIAKIDGSDAENGGGKRRRPATEGRNGGEGASGSESAGEPRSETRGRRKAGQPEGAEEFRSERRPRRETAETADDAGERRPVTRSRKKAEKDWNAYPAGGNDGFDWEAFQRYDDAAAWEKPKRGGGTRSVRRSGRPVTTGRQAAPKRIAAKGRKR